MNSHLNSFNIFDTFFFILDNDVGYVVVQFYPWFKFSFCFKLIIIHYHIQKQKKRKFKPRMKLNHNRYIKTSNKSRSTKWTILSLSFWHLRPYLLVKPNLTTLRIFCFQQSRCAVIVSPLTDVILSPSYSLLTVIEPSTLQESPKTS